MVSENGKIHLLVFEEDTTTAGLIEKTLTRYGYAVELEHDAKSAIVKGSADQFHMVIGDVCNPDKSGFEVLRNLHYRPKPIPFLALSERTKPDDRMKAIE